MHLFDKGLNQNVTSKPNALLNTENQIITPKNLSIIATFRLHFFPEKIPSKLPHIATGPSL